MLEYFKTFHNIGEIQNCCTLIKVHQFLIVKHFKFIKKLKLLLSLYFNKRNFSTFTHI